MVSIRNIVMLAIMQVGVIVAGVLAAGVCYRMSVSDGMMMPILTLMLYRLSVTVLLLPLAWVTGAAMIQLRTSVSDNIKILMFWAGILLLIALAIFVFCADVPPLVTGLINMHSNNGGMDDGL